MYTAFPTCLKIPDSCQKRGDRASALSETKMKKTLEMQTVSDMNLVNIINETEGFAWKLNHDKGHGRIEGNISPDIRQLMKTRDKATRELEKRTGIKDLGQMRNHIKAKLKEQDEMWDRQWAELYQEGSMFRLIMEDKKKVSPVFETVRIYLPVAYCSGPKQIILARPHGYKHFATFDDRKIPELEKANDIKPIYTNMLSRGLIKADEEKEFRITGQPSELDMNRWNRELTDYGAIFFHKGFDDIFETFERYNLPNMPQERLNEVILARGHKTPFIVEFTPYDLKAIEPTSEPSKYIKKSGGGWTSSHGLTVEDKRE